MKTVNAIAKGFRTGDIDLALDLLPEDLETVLQDPRFRRSLVEVSPKTTYDVLFNTAIEERENEDSDLDWHGRKDRVGER